MASSPQRKQDIGEAQVKTAAKGKTLTPRKTTHRQVSSPSDSNSRRQTRLSTLSTMATAKTEHKKDVSPSSSGIKTTTSSIPSSANFDPMGRKLNFDSTESERRMHAIRMAPDPPPFDLSTPPETTDQDELVVNEANKEVEIQEAEAIVAAPTTKEKTDASRSTTPVVHEYQKRNVKIGHLAKSPFVNLESKKNYSVSKSVETLYNMVCEHGWKTTSPTNKEIVIDTTNYYCNLGQLADSVAPGKMLINTVAEIGIHIMTLENKNPKKYIMPLRVAVSKQSSVLFVLFYICSCTSFCPH
jgi:hypothetical protein